MEIGMENLAAFFVGVITGVIVTITLIGTIQIITNHFKNRKKIIL